MALVEKNLKLNSNHSALLILLCKYTGNMKPLFRHLHPNENHSFLSKVIFTIITKMNC